MNKSPIYSIWIVLLTIGCTSRSEDQAIKVVAALTQAQSVITVSGFQNATDKEELRYKGLELSNSPLFDKEDAKEKELLSISSLLYFQNMSEEDLEGKNAIRMKITSNVKGIKKEVETIYEIADLQTVLEKSQELNKAMEQLVAQNYAYLYQFLHPEIKAKGIDSATFTLSFDQMDAQYGKVKQYTLQSFEMDKGHVNSVTEEDAIYFLWLVERERATTGMVVGVLKERSPFQIITMDVLR